MNFRQQAVICRMPKCGLGIYPEFIDAMSPLSRGVHFDPCYVEMSQLAAELRGKHNKYDHRRI